ncbi:MAG: AHH domain-containing protein [Ktedonobacterales bacterium]
MANDLPGGLGAAQTIQVDPAALTQAANYISRLADQVRAERGRMQQSYETARQGWTEPTSWIAYEQWFTGADAQLGQRESELRGMAAHLAQTAQTFQQADVSDTGGRGSGVAATAGEGELVTGTNNSAILSANITKNGNRIHLKGTAQPAGTSAHHIVPATRNLPSTNAARDILTKYGINVNDAQNGVFMWTDPTMYPNKLYYHKGPGVPDLHTNVYYDNVLRDLRATENAGLTARPPETPAQIRVAIEKTLANIGNGLRAGTYPIR